MKKVIILITTIFLVISLLSYVSAIGFSPNYLKYNLEKDKQECQSIHLVSDSAKIIVSDKWAENKDGEWKVSLFNSSSDKFNLILTYPKELSIDQREVPICLSGQQNGIYRGAILLTEQQVGNSIVQAGVWLLVNITDQNKKSENEITTTTINPAITQNQTQEQNNQPNEQNQKESTTPTNSGITGNVVGGGGMSFGIWIIGFIVIIFVAAFFVYRYRRKRWEQGY